MFEVSLALPGLTSFNWLLSWFGKVAPSRFWLATQVKVVLGAQIDQLLVESRQMTFGMTYLQTFGWSFLNVQDFWGPQARNFTISYLSGESFNNDCVAPTVPVSYDAWLEKKESRKIQESVWRPRI
jgi:hypothetical protein